MNVSDNTSRRRTAWEQYKSHVNAPILSRNGKEQGVIKSVSSRYCAACQSNSPCYVVLWDDEQVTKPCVHGVAPNADGVLQIK